jgi:membrane-associated phospholipid phosphatase
VIEPARDGHAARLNVLVTAMSLASVLFGILALFVAVHPTPTGLERAVDNALIAPAGSTSFTIFKVTTYAGSSFVVAVAAAVLAVECWRVGRDLRLGLLCVLAPLLTGVAVIFLKPGVGRSRPETAVRTGESGFGFPSGHAAGSTALAVCAIAATLMLIPIGARRRGAIALAVAYVLLVGVSRVVVGAHHSADVLGGWLIGGALATAVYLGLYRWTTPPASPSDWDAGRGGASHES